MGILLPFLFLSLVILVQAGNRMAKVKRKTKLKQNSRDFINLHGLPSYKAYLFKSLSETP